MFSGKKLFKPMFRAVVNLLTKNKGISMFLMSVIMMVVFYTVFFSQAALASDVKVFFNGAEVFYDVPAQFYYGRVMIPLSQTLEAITGRGTVYYPSTQTSTFNANGHVNMHVVESNLVFIDGVPKEYDVPSIIVGDRLLAPIDMIADTTGYTINWSPEEYFVRITGQQTPAQPNQTAQPSQPVPSTPQTGVDAGIISVETNKTNAEPGDHVILTIKTTSAVNYVRINDGNKNNSAIYASTDTSGVKTWVLAYTPAGTVNLFISASATEDMAGAVQRTQQIIVVPKLSISDVTANKTSISYGETVTLTIKTSSSVGFVNVAYDNTSVNATYGSSDSAGIKTWTATFAPKQTQTVVVSANQTQTTSGAVTRTQSITVNTTAAVIHSVSPNKTSIHSGEAVQITIRTNSAANYVWVDVNNGTASASYQSTDSSGVKTWTATCYPYESQNFTVLANTTYTTNGAVRSSSQYITVGGSSVSIIDVNASQVASNNYINVTVRTTASATNVWIDTGAGSFELSSYSVDSSGYKVWTGQQWATSSSYWTAYAGRSGSSREDSRSFYVYGYEQSAARIISTSINPTTLSSDRTNWQSISVNVRTNSIVSSVYYQYNNSTYTLSYNGSDSNGDLLWTSNDSIVYNGVNQLNITAIANNGGSPATSGVYFNVH